MSRLDELINELCPDGVEYKTLGSVTINLKKGTLKKEQLTNDGDYPVQNSGTSFYGYYNDYNNDYGITIAARGENAGYVTYINQKFWAGGLCYPIKSYDEKYILTKFMFYYLKNIEKSVIDSIVIRGSIPAVNKSDLDKTYIPLPPLPVQEEIVRILDTFTELTTELTTELNLRKYQYCHYVDLIYNNVKINILNSTTQGKITTFEELGQLVRGKRFVRNDIKPSGIPAIHYGDLYTHYGPWADVTKIQIDQALESKMRFAKTNDVIIVGAGETVEDIGIGVAWLGMEDVAVHDACYTFKHKEDPKYISYFLRTSDYHKQIRKYISSGKISSIPISGLSKASIPVPSIEIQEEIVIKLDSFSSYISDSMVGLPAEIELRQKQYEYYRDKLLTFKRKD